MGSDREHSFLPDESQTITPTCKANRGVDGAWDEAVRRLREVYDAWAARDESITLAIKVWRNAGRPGGG